MKTLLASLVLFLCFMGTAEARQTLDGYVFDGETAVTHHQKTVYRQKHVRQEYAERATPRVHVASFGDNGRPSAWCGWYMRQVMGVADASYNLAANWAHFGSATSPHVGAIVVWPHHVGRIAGPCNGSRCVVESGNYNNRVAVVSMNVGNAIAFRE